jgi:hypothetical protein
LRAVAIDLIFLDTLVEYCRYISGYPKAIVRFPCLLNANSPAERNIANMRSQSWRNVAAAALGCLVARTSAQTGSLTDLGTLLAGQKNLTTFYSLIQVCCVLGQSVLRDREIRNARTVVIELGYKQKYPNILLQLPSFSGVTVCTC